MMRARRCSFCDSIRLARAKSGRLGFAWAASWPICLPCAITPMPALVITVLASRTRWHEIVNLQQPVDVVPGRIGSVLPATTQVQLHAAMTGHPLVTMRDYARLRSRLCTCGRTALQRRRSGIGEPAHAGVFRAASSTGEAKSLGAMGRACQI